MLIIAIFKSGQNITSYTYNAISSTTSSHVFNIAVPSLETVISREVLWEATFTLRIDARVNAAGNPSKPPDMFLVNYGVTDALAQLPPNSLDYTKMETLNNTTVAMNMDQLLPAILRQTEP